MLFHHHYYFVCNTYLIHFDSMAFITPVCFCHLATLCLSSTFLSLGVRWLGCCQLPRHFHSAQQQQLCELCSFLRHFNFQLRVQKTFFLHSSPDHTIPCKHMCCFSCFSADSYARLRARFIFFRRSCIIILMC